MEYPTLYVKQKSRQMSDAFLGYNHNLRIGDNEFYDMKNMTSDYYPVLAPRKKRVVYYYSGNKINGLIAKYGICFVEGSAFCYEDTRIDMGLSDSKKDLISIGSYVVIMPDRKYINTIPKDGEYEWGNIDAVFETTKDVEFTLCTLTGEAYENAEISDVAPTSPVDGQLWIDTSSTPNTLKKYYEANGMWVSIATTYIKIQSEGIGKNFKQYDGVKISGITTDGVTSLNGYHVLQGCKDDEIIVIGMLDKVITQTVEQGKITISRKMPVMDFIVESNNRLWGCRYGTNEDGDIVNEIYASKLGDFKNWNCFMGISTDSWVGGVGTDGPFTGAISYLGNPLFFKGDCIHKVYGDYPASYRVQDVPCSGVQSGSSKSLAIVNGTLFYKARTSVCAYDGSMPVEISNNLGDIRYMNAVACAFGNKYYINMDAGLGRYSLFVYDTEKGMWHKEDNIRVDDMCALGTGMWAIDSDTQKIITMSGGLSYGAEDKVPWMVESGIIGMSTPDMKYISKLVVRMSLEEGASVSISIQYDSVGDWKQVCSMRSTSLRSFSVPIRPMRCDHFRIRIEGEGDGKIYSITKTIEQGSDVS